MTTLIETLDIQIKEKREKVKIGLHAARNFLKSQGEFVISSNETISMVAVDQFSGEKHTVELNKWYLNNKLVHNNTEFVDAIKNMGIATATIFQKIPQGYLRISTNVINNEGTRAVGTYIPNSSPVAQTVDKGQKYYGRAWGLMIGMLQLMNQL